MELLVPIRKLFSIPKPVCLTEFFENILKKMEDYRDYRDFFLPKNRIFRQKKIHYQQVFSNRYDFIPNLACIDYLFTTGTDF
jgi:hypothetical protein